MLTHFALLIDLKQKRLEKTDVPFLRKHLCAELDELLKRFHAEYQQFLISTGSANTEELLQAAA